MVASEFLVVLVFAVAARRTPSPCTVQSLTANPSMHWLAADYCRIDTLWRKAKEHRLQELEADVILGSLEEAADKHTCSSWYENADGRSWDTLRRMCNIPYSSSCRPRNAAEIVAMCAVMDVQEQYDSAKRWNVYPQRSECHTDSMVRKHAQRVTNDTWSKKARANVTAALARLDECVEAMHKQPSTFAAAHRLYAAEMTAKAERDKRKAYYELNVACMLIKDVDLEVHSTLIGRAAQNMLERWKAKYCGH